MEESRKGLENLKAAVERVRDYFEKPESYKLEPLVTETIGPALEQALKNLCPQIEERHKIDASKEQENILVIHYTSLSGLVSMLQDASKQNDKSKFRLYNSFHFNDPEEGNYLTHSLLRDYKWLGKTDMRHAYIASFIHPDTKEEQESMSNDLIFWRTYGQEGEGCSLSLLAPLSRLLTVSYGPDSQNAKLTVKDIRAVLDLLGPLKIDNPSVLESTQKRLADIVLKPLEKIRYLYKNEAYVREKECRCVILESEIEDDDKKFEYQDRNNYPPRIKHYCEDEDFHLEKLMESRSYITLGPCVPYRDDVNYCIGVLKERANWKSEIRNSKIPYRKY